jgi:hypothetical protein
MLRRCGRIGTRGRTRIETWANTGEAEAAAERTLRYESRCGIVLDFSCLGEFIDNPFIEAFTSRFRAECLNQDWFLTFSDATEKLETWRRFYSEERQRGAIGNKVPILLTKSGSVTGQSC